MITKLNKTLSKNIAIIFHTYNKIVAMNHNNEKIFTSTHYSTTNKLNRKPYIKLWKIAKLNDKAKHGYVVMYFPELVETFGSGATLYRWLQLGKKDGAFRFYRKRGNYLEISYGSQKNIAQRMKAADLEVAVQIPLEEITCNTNEEKLRQKTTLHTAQTLQTRSRNAAIKELRASKNRHIKLARPKLRRGTLAEKPTCQYFPTQKQWGVSQKTLAATLGVSERTIRRHVAKTPRVQGLYKVSKSEGQAELFYSQEERTKPKIFFRKGEYWKYGTNLYNLDYEIKNRWTARLRYKFDLLKDFRSRPEDSHKKLLSVEAFFDSDWFGELNLEELLYIRNFDKFRKAVKYQLRELKRRRTM